MAQSKCSKCDSTFFEAVEKEISGYKFKLSFIQCAKCGNVVGVMEYLNIGAVLKSMEKKLGIDKK
jgi:hypothetical protein